MPIVTQPLTTAAIGNTLASVVQPPQREYHLHAGTSATLAAKRATTTLPIVFGHAAFPERTGLVASLARPGGNLIGVAFIGPEYGKRLELLREVAPKLARRVALQRPQPGQRTGDEGNRAVGEVAERRARTA